jgi:hypothetical protein
MGDVMARLTARIDGVVYELQEPDGTTAGDLAEKWARFVKEDRQTYLSTGAMTPKRVWVNWGRVTSFEVSEVDAY